MNTPAKKTMLIDASHPEETRVVILDAQGRIDDFEAETQGKQQLKGNIYIGHVSRVEPSLQAAFITYGGNRNGFLAFGEVHPQFFAVKDSEKAELLEEMAAQAARRRGLDREEEEAETQATTPSADFTPQPAQSSTETEITDAEAVAKATAQADAAETANQNDGSNSKRQKPNKQKPQRRAPKRVESRARPQRVEAKIPEAEAAAAEAQAQPESQPEASTASRPQRSERNDRNTNHRDNRHDNRRDNRDNNRSEGGGRHLPAIHRRYRIQDVLKEGQKIMVQVVKEERGSKGAALTTYFSMPGRYTVLMPNTPYAGGISRKITDPEERRTLRDTYAQLNVPDTMGLIIRTAGVGQDIEHIKTDYQNLTNLWQHIQSEFEKNDDIQCIHEDGSVIVRALRDMISDDIGEIIISGSRAYKMAKDYAKNLSPEAAKLIRQHKEDSPLFTEYKVEQKLNHLHHTRVTLPSGGYLIINPTEALVSVDINSGRATQERNIEETAVKTNLEACDELARQIRLRDLAGLIVVDFIDMEDHRNVRKVENAMRKALRKDRARIQTGNISEFGLMEISRQRLRPSFGESHFITCPHCQGSGTVHSPATSALMVLRRLEESDIKGADRIIITSSTNLVLWLLNHKRDLIRTLEERNKYQLQFKADDTLTAPDHRLELIRIKADGTESKQTIDVNLREQPELPPEKRQYSGNSGGQSNGYSSNSSGSGNNSYSRPEKSADKTESRTESPRPPKRENQSESQPEKPKQHQKPEQKAPQKTEAKSETKAEPKPVKPKPEVKDEPLAVQKVVAESKAETPVAASTPRKTFALKKQADTDAPDTPLAVQKQTAATTDEPIPAKPKKAAKGIISRLIGS